MIALDILSDIANALHPDDTGEEALTMMQLYHVRHLPIVKNNDLLGFISEDNLLNNTLESTIKDMYAPYVFPFVYDNAHYLDILSKMGTLKISSIPVVNKENSFVGIITYESLLGFLAAAHSLQELGGVLVIEVEQHNYSPTEICRRAESDSYIVNYLHATPGHKDNYVYITLKVNRKEIQPLKAAFEKQAPKEPLEIMHEATEDLQKSGILKRVLQVGDAMPQFELENAEGKWIRSKDILSNKRMVLSFYRGRW